MDRERERKEKKRLKALKWTEEQRIKKTVHSKVCKITKGKHVFDRVFISGIGRWKKYDLHCACGKSNWNIPSIHSLESLPKYNVCMYHGYLREGENCWACTMGLTPFIEE